MNLYRVVAVSPDGTKTPAGKKPYGKPGTARMVRTYYGNRVTYLGYPHNGDVEFVVEQTAVDWTPFDQTQKEH